MLNSMVKDAGLPVHYANGMESMGDRIKQLRVAQGLTQPQLAERVGVTKSAVSQWEDGSTSNVKLEVFLLLCEVLRTDPKYLVWGPDRAPTDTSAPGRHRRPSISQR
jgi:transcriptional regulator with XRE-family HTH domain